MNKIFMISLILTTPALADFENMCGVEGYSVFNAVYAPYLPAEFDNGPFDAGDTFTCAANTPRVLNAVYTPYLPAEYDNGPFDADDIFTCAANTPRVLNAVFELGTYTCAAGYYLSANSETCTICPENSYCPGGTYTFNETTAQGITACATGLYAPAGMSNANQCGHILHVGNEVVYLHSVKKTSPALHVKMGNDIFYGNLTTADVPMNINTNRRLKMRYNDVVYSVYDDTVNIE